MYQFLIHEVAVGHEVLHVGVVERPVFHVANTMALLLDMCSVDIVHGDLISVRLRHVVGTLL